MKISFYKTQGSWFADLPDYIEQGGTEADCLMVAGADTWLDKLSGGKDTISLLISDKGPLREKMERHEEDEFGATYVAHTYEDEDINHQLWLCPVTLFVFNKYPKTIYYEIA